MRIVAFLIDFASLRRLLAHLGFAPPHHPAALYTADGKQFPTRFAEAFAVPEAERRTRMMRLQRAIRDADVFDWVDSFLAACPAA